MPRMPIPLTNTKINAAKPKGKNYTLADGRGLHLLIKTNGSKLWEFVYQSPTTHKRRKTSFKSYPTVSIKQARDKRTEYLNLINDEIDPIDHFKTIKEEANNQDGLFENVVNEWLELRQIEVKEKTLTEKSYQRIESLLKNDIVPFFKKVENSKKIKPIFNNANIKDIKHSHIVKAIEEKNKTAPVSAKRLLQYLSNLTFAC